MVELRLPDFAHLSDADRYDELRRCKRRLATLGLKLRAVVRSYDPVPRRGGPLADWPYVAKDIFADGETAATWGCAESPIGVEPPATVLTRLDEAGACRLAAAEMTQLAYEPSGHNAARGRSLNPWDRQIIAGGSSSGAAVLVAAGCCAFALGSDTAGSVRIPAHCCGVTALKPTWGAIPVEGTMPLAPSLDTIGVIARSAADIGRAWQIVADRPGEVGRIRSAVVLGEALEMSDNEIAEACRAGIAAISDLGVQSVERRGMPDDADRQTLLVLQAEAARTHASRLDDARIEPTLRRRLSKGFAISDEELRAALDARDRSRNEFLLRMMGEADIALLPIMPIRTPSVVDVDPNLSTFNAKTLYSISRFTRFANYLGLPVLAVPVGFDSRGVPIGLQIVGRPHSEASLIALGMELQGRHDWHGRVPAGIVSDIAAEKGDAA